MLTPLVAGFEIDDNMRRVTRIEASSLFSKSGVKFVHGNEKAH